MGDPALSACGGMVACAGVAGGCFSDGVVSSGSVCSWDLLAGVGGFVRGCRLSVVPWPCEDG